MMTWLDLFGVLVVLCPLVTLSVVGLTELFQRPMSEGRITLLTKANLVTGLIASLAILGYMLFTGDRQLIVDCGNFVVLDEEHFHFHIKFLFDRLSIPMVILSYVLVGVIGAFASKYLHNDAGFHRFFVVFAMFLVGLLLAFLAGTIETLFLGWELVGLSSALLIAYFHDRAGPVRNGLWVWTIYRFADAAFLMAAVAMHHMIREGDFAGLMGAAPWPDGTSALDGWDTLLVGSLLLVAAAGKSGLVPFSGWLPRAMEGPTPSSAVFYGALSIHLGAFLLLRMGPILDDSPLLRAMVIVLGGATALLAALVSRVQSDVKSALAYASVCQVGIIVVEIGLGLWYLALAHMIGHAFLRSLQLLRAPNLLRDYKSMENAIGGRLARGSFGILQRLPVRWQQIFFLFALERGYTDQLLWRLIVNPFLALFRQLDRWETRWSKFLSNDQEGR